MQPAEAKRSAIDIMAQIEGSAGLTARQKNRLKREEKKRRKRAEEDVLEPAQHTVAADVPGAAKRAKLGDGGSPGLPHHEHTAASAAQGGGSVAEAPPPADAWPFASFCTRLREHLLHSSWEVRHGAGVGLLALLRTHGTSVGAPACYPPHVQRQQNAGFCEDLALRVCCVLHDQTAFSQQMHQ